MSALAGRHARGRVYVRKFDYDEAARLYRDGASGMEIAARFGVTHKAVYDALHAVGVELRSPVTTARDGELQCGTCREWKRDDAFPRNRSQPARRGRHQSCRSCQADLRQQHRIRNRVPCSNCGKPRFSPREVGSFRHGHKDTGLCLTCYRASIRNAA